MVTSAAPGTETTTEALVIGGDPDFQNRITVFLEKRGFHVSTCRSFAEGQTVFKNQRLVLTVIPPGSNGEIGRFVDYVRSRSDENQPLIVGIGDPPSGGAGNHSGLDDLLKPPIDLRDLGKRLDASIPRRQGSLASKAGVLRALIAAAKPTSTKSEPEPG